MQSITDMLRLLTIASALSVRQIPHPLALVNPLARSKERLHSVGSGAKKGIWRLKWSHSNNVKGTFDWPDLEPVVRTFTFLDWFNKDSLTAALYQLRVVASSTSNDLGLWSGQHQQTGQCLLPLVAAKFFVDDPADSSSQRQEECQCGLLLTVAVPANGST